MKPPLTKIIERRCVILGLHTPQTAVLQIVEANAPKETSTDRIERALNALIEDQKKDPTTCRRKGPPGPCGAAGWAWHGAPPACGFYERRP